MAKQDVTGSIAAKDFQRDMVASLAKRGIRVVGATWLPGPGGDFSRGERGYLLDDNGTGRVRTYLEVMKLAREAFESIVAEGRHRQELKALRKKPQRQGGWVKAGAKLVSHDKRFTIMKVSGGYNLLDLDTYNEYPAASLEEAKRKAHSLK